MNLNIYVLTPNPVAYAYNDIKLSVLVLGWEFTSRITPLYLLYLFKTT